MPFPPEYWDLEKKPGTLGWAGCDLRGLAERYGTPLYVVNGERLNGNIHRFVHAVRGAFPQAGIFHSVKTSGIPDLIPIMAEAGIGAETAAAHEILLCRRRGIPGEMILFGGVNRSVEDFALALGEGVGMIVLDSLDEARALREACAGRIEPVRVSLRLALGIRAKPFLPLQNTSIPGGPYGFDPDGKEFREVLRLLQAASGMLLAGLHSHIGTGIRAVAPFVRNARAIVRLYARLRAEGFALDTLNVGGGLGVPSVREFSPWDFLLYAAFGRMPAGSLSEEDLVPQYIEQLRRTLREACDGQGVPLPRIHFEPGRILTSDAVLLLLKVGQVKRSSSDSAFAFVDGGAMSVGLSSLAEHHALIPLDPAAGGEERYTFIGRVPTSLDVLYRNRLFSKLRGGEYIAFMDAGAYMIPTATSFASMRSPIVFCAAGREYLLRPRETPSEHATERKNG